MKVHCPEVKIYCPCCGTMSATRLGGVRGDGRSVHQCVHCGCGVLQHADQVNVPGLYGEAYFSKQNPAYFANYEAAVEDLKSGKNPLLRVLSRYSLLKGASLLDVGCASGALLAAARDAGCQVEGLEISAYAAHETKTHLAIPVINGSLTNTVLPSGSVDIVTLIDVIEHASKPDDDLCTIKRVLREKGLLMIMTPNYDVYKLWGAKWHGYNASYEHIFFFGRKSLSRLLKRQGFDIIHEQTFGMVDTLNYYFPNPRRSAGTTRILNRVGRAISNKLLVPLGMEHRLLMVARKTGSHP